MKNVDIRHLRYAAAVADELSFSKAAERVSIAQPHLSREIGKLEKELGYALFERTNRKVALTQRGAAFIRRSKRVIDELNVAVTLPAQINRPIDIIYNDIPVPVNVYDEFGWLIGGNEAWIDFWKIDDLVEPRQFNILQDEQIPQDIRCKLLQVFQHKSYTMVTDLYFDPAVSKLPGIPRHICLMILPMLNDKKQFKHFIAIHIDRTENLQMRSELTRLRAENANLKKNGQKRRRR